MRFEGWIAGLGTTGGHRIVLGHWPVSPFGPVSDVMVERPDGWRLLLAPTTPLAEFIAGMYDFDEVRVTTIAVRRDGPLWTIDAGPLAVTFETGRRGPLGLLLRCVPAWLAARTTWVWATDLPARLLLPGVRTRGIGGASHREWYGARDLLPIRQVTADWEGHALGDLAEVDPPVRFGFSSAPRSPALVRVTTTIRAVRPSCAAPPRPPG